MSDGPWKVGGSLEAWVSHAGQRKQGSVEVVGEVNGFIDWGCPGILSVYIQCTYLMFDIFVVQ